MASAHVELSVDVDATAEEVFDYFTAWERQGEWMFGTHVEIRTNGELGNGHGLGAEIAAFTGFGRIGFWDDMRITRWQAPHRVDVVHLGRVVRGTGSMLVERTGDSTARFIWSEELELPLGAVGAVGFAILKPLFLAGVQASLNKFARQFAAPACS